MRLVLLSKNQNRDLDQDKTVPVREPGSSSEIMSSKYRLEKKKIIQAGSRPAWRAGRSLEAQGLREMGRDSQTHPRSPSERGQAEAEAGRGWRGWATAGFPVGQQCPEKPLPARLRKSKSRLDAGQFSPWPPAPRRWLRLWAPGSTVGVQRPRRCPETRVGGGRGSWAAGRRKGEGKGPALSWEPSCPLVSRLPLPSPTPQARSGLTEPLPVGCALAV